MPLMRVMRYFRKLTCDSIRQVTCLRGLCMYVKVSCTVSHIWPNLGCWHIQGRSA